MKNNGLYIHIPFCASKCSYCDFFSTPRHELAKDYVKALQLEYEARLADYPSPNFSTIYIGGGTPSSLGTDLLDQIMGWLPLDGVKELTIEVNPEDINRKMAEWLASSPVNRVSMGIQTFSDDELRYIGRRHSAQKAAEAFELLRNTGMDNISIDLMFGLPKQSFDSWCSSLQKVIALQPDHISAYALMLEKGTRLWAMKQAGKFSETDDEVISDMYDELCTILGSHGYSHYEISNFALPGKQSLHNSAYWDLSPYLGLGTGAHSYYNGTRFYNPTDLRRYIQTPETFNEPDLEEASEKINDYIMIRMRTARGLDLDKLAELFGHSARITVERNMARHLANGNLSVDGPTVSIPENLFLVSDPIIADLFV